MTRQHITDSPQGAVVYIGNELIFTFARKGEGWTVLIEGDTECDKTIIPITVETVNDGETVSWEV